MAITESELVERITERVLERLKKERRKDDFAPKGYGGGKVGGGGVYQFKYLSDTPTYPSEWSGKVYNIPVVDTLEENLVFHPMTETFFIPAFERSIVAGTWTILGGGVSQWCGYIYNTPDNNLDEIKFPYSLPAGTYDICWLTTKEIKNGIIQVRINGVTLIDTFDAFNTIKTDNFPRCIYNVTFSTSGRGWIHFKVNGKNPSSTGYQCKISGIQFTRQ